MTSFWTKSDQNRVQSPKQLTKAIFESILNAFEPPLVHGDHTIDGCDLEFSLWRAIISQSYFYGGQKEEQYSTQQRQVINLHDRSWIYFKYPEGGHTADEKHHRITQCL